MATPEEQKRLGLGDDQPTAGLGSQLPDPFTFPPGAPTEPQGNFIPQDQAAPQDPAPQEEGPGRASRIGTQLLDLKSLLEGRRRHSTVERERAEDREMQRAKFERDEARFEFTRTASELNAETERLQQSVLKGNLESQFDDFASAYGDSYNEALTQKGQEAATTKFYADGEKRGYPKSLLDAADSFIRANDRNIEVNALGNLQIQATRALDYYKKHFTKDFIKIQEGGITIPEIAAINDTLPDHMLDKNGRPVDLRLDNKSQFPMLVRALEKGFQIAGIDSTALTKERELEALKAKEGRGTQLGKIPIDKVTPESAQLFSESEQADPNRVGDYSLLVPRVDKSGKPDLRAVASIRDRFGADSKRFVEAQTQFKEFMGVLRTGPTSSGAGDVATTYKFIKYLDQNSTMLPSELKLGQSIGSLADMTQSEFTKLFTGIRLNNKQRAGMEQVVAAIFSVHMQDQFQREGSLTKWANNPQIGLDPEIVVNRGLMDPKMREAMAALAGKPDMVTAELPEDFDFDLGALLESGKQ